MEPETEGLAYVDRTEAYAAQIETAKAAAVASAPEVDDIDPGAWLTSDDSTITGTVRVKAGNLKIAALTEKEMGQIQKASTRPDPTKGKRGTKFDAMLFKQLIVVKSFSKVTGQIYAPDLLANKLAGEVVRVADAITELSGYNSADPEKVGEVFD